MAQANPAAAVANIYQTPELWEKITFTFLCLVIYRVGAHITAPGVDVVALHGFLRRVRAAAALLGLYDLFVGGGLSRATVFALGIMPYISASIFMQIAGAVVPTVEKMQKDEEGRKKAHAVDALPHGAARRWCRLGLRALHSSRCQSAVVDARASAFQRPDDAVPHDGRDVRDVARRADHGARPRQRRVADHLLLDHRALLAGHLPARSASCSTGAVGAVLAARARRRDGGGRRRRRGDHDGGATRADPDPAAHDGARPHA